MALRRGAGDRAGPRGERVLRSRGGLSSSFSKHPPPEAAALSPQGARLRLAALALAIASLFALVTLSGGLSSERVRNWIEPLGVAAPLAFVPISATLTVALFPGPLLAGASGLLFGTALGFPVSLASAVLGASAAFTVSRRLGARSLERLAGPRLERMQGWIEARGFLAVLYARIAPGVPYNLVNYAAGLTRIPLRTFAAATALGAAPRAFAYTALGGSLDDLTSPEALVAFAVLGVMAVAGGVLAWRSGRSTHDGEHVPGEIDPSPVASSHPPEAAPGDTPAAR